MKEISITLTPSWPLAGLLLCVALVGLWVIASYVTGWVWQWLLAILLVSTTAYYVLRDAMLRLPNAWKNLQVTAHGELRLTNVAGQTFTPILAVDTLVHPCLTIILCVQKADIEQQGFEENNAKNALYKIVRRLFGQANLPPLLIFAYPDSADYRRLRVWLRWWRHEQQQDAAGYQR